MKEENSKSPILLISFNRPDYIKRTLERIITQNPAKLYCFQDGARKDNEEDSQKCAQVREAISKLTKNTTTNVKTYFSDKNLGCGPGPAAAISWFFEHEERGIIIEDDAVPDPEFFPYAEEMLERYANDPTVMAIGSMNIDRHKWGEGSYYFSRMNRNLCAWATWRRAWTLKDLKMKDVSLCDLNRALKAYGCGIIEREYWKDRLREIHKDGMGNASWDMQFFMSIWLRHGKGIIPNVNLSSNIGTVGEATHSMQAGNIIDNIPTSPILPIKHPADTSIQYKADKEFHYLYFEPSKAHWGKAKVFKYIINKRIKRLVGHTGPWIKR